MPQLYLGPPVMVPSEYDVFNSQRPQRFLQHMAAAKAQSQAARGKSRSIVSEQFTLTTIVEDDAESERKEEPPRIAMEAC